MNIRRSVKKYSQFENQNGKPEQEKNKEILRDLDT